MASHLTLDTIAGAVLDIMATSGTIIRTGTVTEVDAATDSEMIFQALSASGMPLLAIDTYPGRPQFTFIRLQVRGFSNNGLVVALTYSTPTGLIPTAFIVRDRSYMSSGLYTRLPGMGPGVETFKITFPGRGGSGSYDYLPPIMDTIAMNILRPMRAISMTSISVGTPPNAGRDQHGTVNDAIWPTPPPVPLGLTSGASIYTSPPLVGAPLPRGYWLLHQFESEFTRQVNYYQTNIEAITRKTEDWSEIGQLRNSATGKWVETPGTNTALRTLLGNTYAYGVQRSNTEALLRVCPFLTSSFPTVFGF